MRRPLNNALDGASLETPLADQRGKFRLARLPWPALARQAWKDVSLFLTAAVICFALTAGTIHFLRSPDRGLPYHDHFASDDNTEWTAYGGNWKVQGGIMGNESNERGAKLVTGSAYWRDYVLQSDVALRSQGDAGVIARVSHPEQGVDAYSGIYTGLRVRDQSLVLGIADHDWQEPAVKTLPYAIVPNVWYHIQLKVQGCRIESIVTRDGNELARLAITPATCPLRGKIGLRSYDSGGLWKNVQVTKVSN
jgi:3-keto-disaccharide hydrolase